MPALRPLAARPSLEFERKEAKALLQRLRTGGADAWARARARHPAIDTAPEHIRLADAQLVIARDYGFTSWPRLVRYFGDLERQRHGQRSVYTRDFYDGSVRSLLVEHRERRVWTSRVLASYVPRFYAMGADDVFASTVTEDDARLTVARMNCFPSWEVLVERTAMVIRQRPDDWDVDPMAYASEAMKAADLDELKRVVEAHPDLLHPSEFDIAAGRSLLRSALHHERRQGRAALRPIIEWLATQGLDPQLELNRQLCGHVRMKTEKVRWLLDRGADPNWVAPNGIPVLEHALIRYWNDEAIDVLASRAVPRKALWIAAGLGDVNGVRRSLDAQGKPTAAARRLRPDFAAVGPAAIPSHPDPDDEEILMEAFFIAILNGRTPVLEYMASRGFPVDSLVYGSPVINIAVGNGMTRIVECLVRCGASLDLRGWRPQQSAREIAREMFENMSDDADRRRNVELCGMDPNAIVAERDARPVEPPSVAANLREALEFAGDDAFRLGQSEIRPENLLFGLLRSGGPPLTYFTRVSRMDLERFRAAVIDRVRPVDERAERPMLPLNSDAQAVVDAARAIAKARRREAVNGLHLLHALVQADDGPAGDLLAHFGSSAATLQAELEVAL